ncbi:unnamed protein product [Meganyctiphanes norvegica]|uniref:C2H2-type domain-containing protein n=1 Tax=Meganyctiphanes norvegica TaxID=48144 RepID=A0AAV2Q9B6_MEGNR
MEMSEIKVKEEIEIFEEQIKIHSVEIKLKEEIEIYEEPKAFTSGIYLVKHEKLVHIKHQITPTEEKPYQCSQCDKFFSLNSHLIGCKKRRTGEKSYQCSHCGKALSQNDSLKTHKRTHRRENIPMQPM